MQFSTSSLFITLCVTSLLIGVLSFLLTKKRSYHFFRTDFLIALTLVIVVRLFLPFEFSFTKTISASFIMNPIYDCLNHNINETLTIKTIDILVIIWAFGSLFNLFRYLRSIYIEKNNVNILMKYSRMIKEQKYSIYFSKYIPCPTVFGISKAIFIPEINWTEKELDNVIKHEIKHIENHDICIKHITCILCILYWWFYPVYILRNEINLLLEMRVDQQVTNKMDKASMYQYIENLLSVQKKISFDNIDLKNQLSNHFINESVDILNYRINYLFEGEYIKKTNRGLLMLVFLLPILANAIILEPYYDTSQSYIGIEDLNKAYVIQNKDNTYTLVLDNQKISITDISDPVIADLPIIKE